MTTPEQWPSPYRSVFEAEITTELRWIKTSLQDLLSTCKVCGHKVNGFEGFILQSDEWRERLSKNEDQIRGLELGMTQVKAVGGVLGGFMGFLGSIAVKLWGSNQ